MTRHNTSGIGSARLKIHIDAMTKISVHLTPNTLSRHLHNDLDTGLPLANLNERNTSFHVALRWLAFFSKRVSCSQCSEAVDLTRDALRQAPCYDPAWQLSREMEIAVHKNYGCAEYWLSAVPGA